MPDGRRDASYPLSLSAAEVARLERQGARFAPATVRVFEAAGVRRGMRVLDVGCGTGESSLLVASLVGKTGSVVGVDRDGGALAVARGRVAGQAGAPIDLVEGDLHSMPLAGRPFDAAVGRFVLMFQQDIATSVGSIATHVRPGGIVAFVEIDRTPTFPSRPQLPLWEQIGALVGEALSRAGTGRHTGMDICPALLAAGLADVRVQIVDAFLQFPGDRYNSWHLVALLQSLLPTLEEHGLVTAGSLGLDTLEERLVAEVETVRGVGRGPLIFGAWGTVPAGTPP